MIRKTPFLDYVLSLFGFLLLWEWLRPLSKVTDTGHLELFLVFIALAMLLKYTNLKLYIQMSIKGAYILLALNYLFFEGTIFSVSWIGMFLSDVFANLVLLGQQDWANLTNLFRSFCFFLFLWVMVYLLHYCLIKKRKILLLLAVTISYITVLDTFTAYQANVSIIRIVVLGFIALGLLMFIRMTEDAGVNADRIKSILKTMIPTVLIVFVGVLVAFFLPKPDPIWPDPVPYLTSFSEKKETIKQIGYDEDDSRLGGPFEGDDSLVFRTEVESRHYWKVETKDVYTGKGWETSSEAEAVLPFTQNEKVPIESMSTSVESVSESAVVDFKTPTAYLVYPQGVQEFITDDSLSFRLKIGTEKIVPMKDEKVNRIAKYNITHLVPNYSVNALMAASEGNEAYPTSDFINRYTQLPDELPPRISELAAKVTEGKSTWFEKAEAIEEYFDIDGFVYDKVNVLQPGPMDDYVDQFLFESKRGYCDNFSTAMIVMLRTQGIPARWVKGYTEGEYRGHNDNRKMEFEVTNNNAHSWVEVYFPNNGWVPFEPTISYDSSTLFNYDTYHDENPVEQVEKSPEQTNLKLEQKEAAEKKEEKLFLIEWWSYVMKWVTHYKYVIVSLVILCLSVSVVVYYKRVVWLPYYYIWRYRKTDRDENFVKAYLQLLKQLELQGISRKKSQTLREYARYVDQYFPYQEMTKLTAVYEAYLYQGMLPKHCWRELYEVWKKLIKARIA